MKKKNIILIIVAIIAFILIVIGTTILSMNASKEENVEKRVVPEYKEEQTITCIRQDSYDDVDEEETVYIQKGVLITRRNTATWNKAESNEMTCKYYTSKNQGLNMKAGIRSSVECNENRGSFTVTYTIAELDKEDTKLKQFDYINNAGIFDYRSWMQFMQKENYQCTES